MTLGNLGADGRRSRDAADDDGRPFGAAPARAGGRVVIECRSGTSRASWAAPSSLTPRSSKVPYVSMCWSSVGPARNPVAIHGQLPSYQAPRYARDAGTGEGLRDLRLANETLSHVRVRCQLSAEHFDCDCPAGAVPRGRPCPYRRPPARPRGGMDRDEGGSQDLEGSCDDCFPVTRKERHTRNRRSSTQGSRHDYGPRTRRRNFRGHGGPGDFVGTQVDSADPGISIDSDIGVFSADDGARQEIGYPSQAHFP